MLLPPPDTLTDDNSSAIAWCINEAKGVAEAGKKLQHTLTHAADKARASSLRTNAKPAEAARLLATTAPLASAFITDAALGKRLLVNAPRRVVVDRLRGDQLGLVVIGPRREQKIVGLQLRLFDPLFQLLLRSCGSAAPCGLSASSWRSCAAPKCTRTS